MLFVHYGQCEIWYVDWALDERVRTDDHINHSRRHETVEVVFRTLAVATKQQSDHEWGVEPGNFDSLNVSCSEIAHVAAEQCTYCEIVLFGEDFGRRHESGLASTVDSGEHGDDCYDCLAAAYVPCSNRFIALSDLTSVNTSCTD